jgi:hypothetical protein
MSVSDPAEAERLKSLGYTLHHVRPFPFERGEKKGAAENEHLTAEGWTVRHNGVFKRGQPTVSEYTKLVQYECTVDGQKTVLPEPEALKLDCPKKRIVKYEPKKGRDALPGERMGIFPYILKKIFDKRVPVKALFVELSKLEEYMEKNHLETVTHAGTTYTANELQFQIAKVDAYQKALKVLANTFYGESGNFRSSVYNILVAAGITCDGQYNIKLVADMLRSRGFRIKYGDTDSVYVTCPKTVFADAAAKYEARCAEITGADTANSDLKSKLLQAKIDFWTEKVQITMRIMNEMKEYIADYLLADNKTLFLKMAYEEVGYPTVFTGKKKYFMTPHIDTINFYPEKYFIRGIDIIKQGQSDIAKQLGHEFIAESMSPENELELIDIARAKIRKYHEMDKPISMFVLTAKYNPTKQNVPVQTFVRRMRTIQALYSPDGPTPNPTLYALYEPPEPGDKFKYVVTKKDIEFKLNGSRVDKKKGDCMEYSRVFEYFQSTNTKMMIDISYYMNQSIIGLFSRFIAYHPSFQPPAGKYDTADKVQYREMDEYCVKQASKYLERLSDEITGTVKMDVGAISREYRRQNKAIDQLIEADLVAKSLDPGVIRRVRSVPETDNRVKYMIETVRDEAVKFAAENCQLDLPQSNAEEWIVCFAPHRRRAQYNYYDSRIEVVIREMFTLFAHTLKFVDEYDIKYARMIEEARLHGSITDDMIVRTNYMSDEQLTLLRRVADCELTLKTLYMLRHRFEYTDTGYRAIRNMRNGILHDPKIDVKSASKQDAKTSEIIEPYVYG